MENLEKYFCVVYWYTTPNNRKINAVKNGSARRKATSAYEAAEQRIKEQITAANSHDPYEILHVEDVSDRCETGEKHESLSRLRQLEQSWLHAKQKRLGMWIPSKNAASEWFKDTKNESVDNVVSVGKSLINEWRHGVARPNAYVMREEQQDCHDQAVAWFNNGGDKFLMNAKMRFGKTFTTYQIIKSMNLKRVLVITYKPAVDASWREDLETHIDFEGWDYYSAKTDFNARNPIQLPGTGNVEILFASFQDLNDFEKAKWQTAIDYEYDLLVIDEMHYGSGTERARKSMERLKFDKTLFVSGTPLKALMSGNFLDEEIYTWGYADEQSKREQERTAGWETELYRWLPVMQFHTFEVSEEAKKLSGLYSSEEGFTLTKFLGSDDGKKLNDESSVKLFFDQFFGIGVRKEHSPMRTHAVNHMLVVVPPNVNSATAVSKFLSKYEHNDHVVINVSGDNVTKLEHVKQLIQANQKTITITCGRFNTGVTVPEWDMVVMLDDTRAPETYFQTIFRCQSPDRQREKELCTVIDFNPQRCLEMIYEFADITAKKGQSTQEAVRTFLEFAPVLDHSGNKTVEVDVNRILNMMAETGGYASRFGSQVMLNWGQLSSDLADKFFGIDPTKNTGMSGQVADNGLENGKNYDNNNKNKTKAELDAEAQALKELKERVITMMRRLPTYLFLEESKIENIDDLINTNNAELFFETVGIPLETFKELCEGFIKTERLNRAIMSYNQIESL